ncbi:MAG: histidine phosphatase family protein [Acidobacteria bacterium]|nr:histidine phosphatase family protein [Acidobacteriota bacterium]
MSTITLIRHGQACAFEKDSDRLTELGFHQSRKLGSYWEGRAFDLAFRGSLRRHRETAEAAGYPGAIENPGWNEYDAPAIIATLGPLFYGSGDPRWTAFQQNPKENRVFQRMFEPLMEAWLAGEVLHPQVEPFVDYQARVLRAFHNAKASGGARIAVFTSGGPIGLCLQHTLAAPARTFLDVNWRIRNSSLTEFTFSSANPERCSLDVFNTCPHLERDAASLTWR